MFNNCYEGLSLPGAGHVSPSVRGGDMDTTGCWPEDSESLSQGKVNPDIHKGSVRHTFHCQWQISGICWIDHISNATVSSHTGLASVGEQIASRRIAIFGILPDWVRRSQPTRLSVPTSTYHLVTCLVGTGSAVLVDQTTDGSIRFATTPATFPRRYGDQPFFVVMAQEWCNGPRWLCNMMMMMYHSHKITVSQ